MASIITCFCIASLEQIKVNIEMLGRSKTRETRHRPPLGIP